MTQTQLCFGETQEFGALGREHLADQAHVLLDADFASPGDTDAARFLAAVLQGEQADLAQAGDVGGAIGAHGHYAAFLFRPFRQIGSVVHQMASAPASSCNWYLVMGFLNACTLKAESGAAVKVEYAPYGLILAPASTPEPAGYYAAGRCAPLLTA